MDTGFGTAVSQGRAVRSSERAFLAISALLFLASAGGTIYWWGTMSGGMSMGGGWWTRMPDQTWLGAAASFMGMWVVMMAAMMLPSLVPTLLGYRRLVRRPDKTRLGGPTALAGVGYLTVWAAFGGVAYLLGVALTAAQMQWMALARWAPVVAGVVMLLAGGLQLTTWKVRRLGCCRDVSAWARSLSAGTQGALQDGLRLGAHCTLCCSGFMLILLVTGMTNLGAMAVVAAAITVERLAPRPELVARAAGIVILAAGALAIARAVGVAG